MNSLTALTACIGLGLTAAACDPVEKRSGPVTSGSGTDAPLPGPVTPSDGHPSLLGQWAANASWCSRPDGDGWPITITLTRFEGYENSCAIAASRPRGEGYDLDLRCVSEGAERTETVLAEAEGEQLTLVYPDRQGTKLVLTRCPQVATVPRG